MIEFRNAQIKLIDNVLEHLFVKGEQGHACFAKIGSGKTRASLEAFSRMRDLGEVKRALVVAMPRVITRTWPDEIEKFGYPFKHIKVNGKIPNPGPYDIVFCSPDSLHKVIDMAEQKAFDLLICDESQRFQGFTTLRMKRMKKILPHIPKRVILTATPRANKMTQLFSQIYIIDDGERLGKNKTVCDARFTVKGGFKGREHVFLKEKEQEVLELISPIVTYISEADIDFDYPALIPNDIICPIDPETERHQDTLKNDLYIALQNGENITVGSAGAAYNSLKQLATGFVYGEQKEVKHLHSAKLDAIRSIANENNGPILVFYWYNANKERLIKELGAANCACPSGLSDKLANKEIDKWMEGRKQFLLAQWASMAEGLNLQAPDHSDLVAYDIPDSGTIWLQGIGRLQRPGGARHIFQHRLILENSIEIPNIERLEGRLTGQDEFLDALKAWASK